MTTRRVLIDPEASSPLRVSASGVDASGASFESLLFDANQAPLRVYLNGWMSVPFVPNGAGDLALSASGPSYPDDGRHPLFLVMWWQPSGGVNNAGQGNSPYGTSPCRRGTTGWGAGASVGGGILTGISFVKSFTLPSGQVQRWPEGTRVGYCIMRNSQ